MSEAIDKDIKAENKNFKKFSFVRDTLPNTKQSRKSGLFLGIFPPSTKLFKKAVSTTLTKIAIFYLIK